MSTMMVSELWELSPALEVDRKVKSYGPSTSENTNGLGQGRAVTPRVPRGAAARLAGVALELDVAMPPPWGPLPPESHREVRVQDVLAIPAP